MISGYCVPLLVVVTISAFGCTPNQIYVQTKPPAAFAYADGLLVGRTPIKIDEEADVALYLPGFLPRRLTPTELAAESGPMREVLAIDLLPVVGPTRPVADSDNGPSDPSRAYAWAQTKAAIDAAHQGDCATVRKLEEVVRQANAPIHASIFVHEISLAACLGASAP